MGVIWNAFLHGTNLGIGIDRSSSNVSFGIAVEPVHQSGRSRHPHRLQYPELRRAISTEQSYSVIKEEPATLKVRRVGTFARNICENEVSVASAL